MFGLVIIASMIIFGGLIALLGDRVGMKVGKKRLSLFGLRPKYTSMIITVLTGFFIAGLTLFILTGLSEYARTAIFRLQTIQHELKTATGRVSQLTLEIADKETKYNQLHQKLSTVVAQQHKVEQQLQETHAQYKTVANNLSLAQNRLANLTKINDDLKNQITNLTLQETRLSQQIQNLEGWLQSLQDQNKNIADKPMIFYVGEILGAKVVEDHVPSEKIYETVVEPLLKEANKVALKRGAQIPGKTDYALRVAPQKIAEVCTAISKINDKAVLRVVVEKNSVAGEPLTVTLEYYPNQIIYKTAQVITSVIVDNDTPDSELRDRLLSLLIVANNKAIDDGIITDGQNLRNITSIQEIAKTISLIREKKPGRFEVCLVADGNIYRVDAFKVKFEVRSV
ncbi:MAG TPA: hypothetical protein DDW65_16215 [Firmicutes bacterium]|jgi:uncharacterized protein (DUF3084 family)|nr:hypothetical protein [Bacillota bacterium]